MKKFLLSFVLLCLLFSGCMSKGKSSAPSVPSIETEARSAELSAQIAEITNIIERYFYALESDDVQALAELTNYRYALFGYEKGEEGWVCPIKTYGNAIAYNLKIEYRGSEEATGWYSARESYYVTYEIDKENREYQNYLKNDPALFDMYYNQEIDDIHKLLENGRYATWKFIGVMKDETTGNWVISGYGTGG
jgi:CHAT domain-containing protein